MFKFRYAFPSDFIQLDTDPIIAITSHLDQDSSELCQQYIYEMFTF